MRLFLRYALITFILLVVHATVINFFTIGNAVPDILLIWLVYVAITLGQLESTIAGFGIGLFIDFMSGGVLGLSALAKSVAGFAAGYFFNENKIEQNLATWRFVVAVAATTVLHHAIFFTIFLQGTDIGLWGAVLSHGIPSTLYTILIAAVPMFVFRRKYQ